MMRRLLVLFSLILVSSTTSQASDLAGFLATMSASYEQGVEFTLEVTLDNTSTVGGGPLDTANPTGIITIPDGLTVKSFSIPGGSCNQVSNTLVCKYPSIAAGDTKTFTVVLEGTSLGTKEISMSVSHDDFDPNGSNNTPSHLVTITEPAVPELSTQKTASLTEVGLGELVTYTIRVTNTGNGPATGIQVQDALPDGVEFVSSSDCVQSLGVITCTTPSLPPGNSAEFQVTVSATKAGTITNTASATSVEVTTPATDTAQITVRKRADVSIEKAMADRAIFGPGSQVFTLVVTNNGPDEAENVTVTDNLPLDPKSTMPVFADPNLPSPCTGGQSVTCPLGTMAPGEVRVITFGAGFNPELFGSDPLVRPDIVSYTNTASVTTSSNDTNASNNESSASGKVLAPPGEGQDAPWTEWVSDPVNPATGEIADTFPADLTLAGPYPLSFARNYASFKDTQGVGESGLGPNWSHSYAWKIDIVDAFGETAYRLVSPTGRTWVFEEDSEGNLIQGSALYAPMQLKEVASGFKAADPRTGVVRTFDTNGQFFAERSRAGSGITLSHANGQLQEVTDGLGRTLTFTWTGDRITTVSDGTRSIGLSYDGNGWLASVVNAMGNAQMFTYAQEFSLPLLVANQKEDGVARFTQAFDAQGRVVSQTDALGGTTSFSYSENVSTVVDPAGRTTTYEYDADGRMISKADAAGTVRYTYDETGRRATIVDRTGVETRMEYHAESGYPLSIQFSDGRRQQASYAARQDVDGFTVYDLTSRTDEGGNVTQYTLDANGNRTTETRPTGESRTAVFNAVGQATSVTVSGKGTTTYTYDSSGQPVGVEAPDGRTRSMAYDAFGRVTTITHADGTTSRFSYDALDRVVEIEKRDGTTLGHTFDVVGNMTAFRNEMGRTAAFTYDAMDQPIRKGDFAGNDRQYTYDPVGLLTSETDRTGRTTSYTYDASGNRTGGTNAAGLTTSWQYDAEGLLTGMNSPGGATTSIVRTPDGDVHMVEDPASATLTYTRNQAGDITGIAGPAGTQSTVTVDASGRMTQMTHEGGDVSLSYDGAGRLASITTPIGSTVSLSSDAAGRMTSRTDGLGRTTTFTHDAAGRLGGSQFPDGTSATYGYDARGRLTSVVAEGASHSLQYDATGNLLQTTGVVFERDVNGRISNTNGIAVTRDEEGRILSFSYPQGMVTYSYDAGGRLSTVRDWDDRQTTFSYDESGRVSSMARPNETISTYSYSAGGVLLEISDVRNGNPVMRAATQRDAAGQIMSTAYEGLLVPESGEDRDEQVTIDGAYQIEGYTWDARGRLTDDGRHTYSWNGLNQMATFNGQELQYDGFGMPVSVSGIEWTWNYATSLPTAASQGSSVAFVYTPAGELLYRVSESGDAWFYHFDEMGNTRLLTDMAGVVVGAWSYDPYGRTIASWGDIDHTMQPFTYRGQEGTMHLGSDIYQMRSRVYDAWTARFLTPDPLVGVNPLHLNPYQYAANNPSVFSDPMGQRETIATAGTAAGIIQTTAETLDEFKELAGKGQSISQLINSGKLGSVILNHQKFGLLTKVGAGGVKLAPNVSGTISAGVETVSSGNVARGAGVGAVDVALTVNPYVAVLVLISDATDFGISLATGGEVQGARIADIWRNGGRFVGSLMTDIVMSPISSEHDFGDSLSHLANDMYEQNGVPGLIFDAGATVYIALGNEDLQAVYDADAEAEVLDRQAQEQQLRQEYQRQRELREFFRPFQNR